MDIRQIRYFMEIAECSSYSSAAKKLFVSQPSLSVAIKNLEEELSFKLFYFASNKLCLTPEGNEFYNHAKEFMVAYDKLCIGSQGISQEVIGTVNIVLPLLVSSIYFSEPIAEFSKLYPKVNINIINLGGTKMQDAIIQEQYDFAVTIRPLIYNEFEEVEIVKSPVVLAVNKNHPLAERTKVTYEDLRDETFITYTSDTILYENFMSKTRAAGYTPKITVFSPETSFLLSLVNQNIGIFSVPSIGFDFIGVHNYKNIKFIDIEGEDDSYQLVMIYKKEHFMSKASYTFLEFIQNWFASRKNINLPSNEE